MSVGERAPLLPPEIKDLAGKVNFWQPSADLFL